MVTVPLGAVTRSKSGRMTRQPAYVQEYCLLCPVLKWPLRSLGCLMKGLCDEPGE